MSASLFTETEGTEPGQTGGTQTDTGQTESGAAEAAQPEGGAAPVRPDHIPEKFWDKDAGAVNVDNLLRSYTELERRQSNPEKLREEWEAERLKARPETPDAYTLPADERFDPEALEASPVVKLWRGLAHKAGMDQAGFESALAEYAQIVEAQQAEALEAERAKLGDTASERIEATALFARKIWTQPEEFEAIRAVASTAAGIAALERVQQMLRDGGVSLPDVAGGSIEDNDDTIRKLMDSPAYYDPVRRDEAVVARVQAYFQKKYPKAP